MFTKLLSLGKIAKLAGYTPAGMHKWAIGGKIPFEPVKRPPEGQYRYEDTPELRAWCKQAHDAKHLAEPRFATRREHDIARKKGLLSYSGFFAKDFCHRWDYWTPAQRDCHFVAIFPVLKDLFKDDERFGRIEKVYQYLNLHPERYGKPRPEQLRGIQPEGKAAKLIELSANLTVSLGELKQKQKLTREKLAKAGNNYRELGTYLATFKANWPDGFKGRFLAPNSEEFQFPFSYEMARAVMNFAAKNSSPLTARILENRPRLVNDILHLMEMT
jgi:hypothetical protein